MEETRADEAYAILKEAVNNKDASTVFGEYVATKHRQYSGYTKNIIEHLINNVLFDADMGKYDHPGSSQQLTIVQLEPTTSAQTDDNDIITYINSISKESHSSSTQ